MPRRDIAMMRGGYGFVIKKGPRRVRVVNLTTFESQSFKVGAELINRYDLRIWVQGFLSAKESNG